MGMRLYMSDGENADRTQAVATLASRLRQTNAFKVKTIQIQINIEHVDGTYLYLFYYFMDHFKNRYTNQLRKRTSF